MVKLQEQQAMHRSNTDAQANRRLTAHARSAVRRAWQDTRILESSGQWSRPMRTEPPTTPQTVLPVLHPFHPHPETARGAATAHCFSIVASITTSQCDSLDEPRSNRIELVDMRRYVHTLSDASPESTHLSPVASPPSPTSVCGIPITTRHPPASSHQSWHS
ncbi:hypothetical protein BD410DRAFT_298262 [Rickenella mellea]|uniref:Uncharacterized protein n=1 Tax=Rickenella mellea TaxID=50990 RepID=A0A4Y7Q1U3_9AGAM|nr:hypothetical protein BD410DRAFT_298262 [Rickenella mellea]